MGCFLCYAHLDLVFVMIAPFGRFLPCDTLESEVFFPLLLLCRINIISLVNWILMLQFLLTLAAVGG